MNRRNFVIGTGGAITAGSIGSLAFTQASVERNLDVKVVSDDATDAALRFQASSGTTINQSGQLVINGVSSQGDGSDAYLTPNGEFTFGDTSSPSTEYAFSMTNQLSESRSFDIAISGVSDSDIDFVIKLFDDTGSKLGEANGSTDLTDLSVSAGQVVYGVIKIVTGDDDSAISGTVTVSADTGSTTTS